MSLTHTPRHTLDTGTDTRVLLTMRWFTTPLWRIRHRRRTALAIERAKFIRECRTNDYAHRLRMDGHDVPVGSVLCGERVTR